MDLSALQSSGKRWAHLLSASLSDTTDALRALERSANGVAVRFIRGVKSISRPAFFDEASAALQFPAYFGYNWDAFDECLCDPDWLTADGFVICVTEAHRLLEASPTDAAKFAEVMQAAAQHWRHPPRQAPAKPFHLVLHALPENAGRTYDQWHALGLPLHRLK
jgi:hypothetical protein